MNKFYIVIFLLIAVVFVSIVVINQANSSGKNAITGDSIPSLPPDSSESRLKANTGQQVEGQSTINAQGNVVGQQAAGQQPAAAAPTFGVDEGERASYSATINTSKGDITLTLFVKDAPNTVKNFVTKARGGFYNGLIFHRVEDWVIQGGDPLGNGTGGGLMKTELNSIPFTAGSLGVARGGDINVSNDSQFFITKTDASWLNQQYTNFGTVTKGMDVVKNMQIGDKILGISIE